MQENAEKNFSALDRSTEFFLAGTMVSGFLLGLIGFWADLFDDRSSFLCFAIGFVYALLTVLFYSRLTELLLLQRARLKTLLVFGAAKVAGLIGLATLIAAQGTVMPAVLGALSFVPAVATEVLVRRIRSRG